MESTPYERKYMAGRQILIDEDTKKVIQIERTVLKEVPINSFYESLLETQPTTIPFIPQNCRGILSDKLYSAFIIEMKPKLFNMPFSPKRHPLFFNPNEEDPLVRKTATMKIYLPWVYWIVVIQNNPIICKTVGLFFAKEKITTNESKGSFSMFPNLHKPSNEEPYGVFCLGDLVVDNTLQFDATIDEMVNSILASNFNYDYWNPTLRSELPLMIKEEYAKITVEYLIGIIEKGNRDEEYWKAKYGLLMESFRWLIAWENLSQRITLKDFCEKWDLEGSSYKTICDSIYKRIGNRNE